MKVTELLQLIRPQVETVNGFFRGHCCLKKHVSRISIVSDDANVETACHIICECPVLWRKYRFFERHSNLKLQRSALLTLPPYAMVIIIITFVK